MVGSMEFCVFVFIDSVQKFLSVSQLVIDYVMYIFSSCQIWEILCQVLFIYELMQLLNIPLARSPKWPQLLHITR